MTDRDRLYIMETWHPSYGWQYTQTLSTRKEANVLKAAWIRSGLKARVAKYLRGGDAAMKASITMSALGPTLAEQCAEQGLIVTGTDIAMSDRLSHAVNLLYVRGVLTDAQCNSARKKIIAGMKLRATKATP